MVSSYVITQHDAGGREGEHTALRGALDLVVATGHDIHAWQLAWSLYGYLERRGLRHDTIAAQQIGLAATQRLDDAGAGKLHAKLSSLPE